MLKIVVAGLLLAGTGVLLLSLSRGIPTQAAEPSPGVAVVELFTSEGCSSCPPADAALADLIRDSRGQPVYALAFHVDYWDSLGWKDAFSSSAATARQNAYGRAFRLDSIYTPQAIVNGREEFVGSNRGTLKSAVATALATPATGTLQADVKRQDGKLIVALASTGLPPGVVLQAALVEAGLSRQIARGENGGRTLTHENVVRDFQSVPPDAAGHATATLTPPADGVPGKQAVIVFAQRASDGQVLAATQQPLPQ